MIRHTVIISFDGVDETLVATIVQQLKHLPDVIPEIASYTVGRDLGLQPGPAAVVVVGDFKSIDDYHTYSTHPAHLDVLDQLIRPNLTGLSRAQIEID